MNRRPTGEVKLTPQAKKDLLGIWNYLAENQSEEHAESYLLNLELQIELLLSHPLMGRSADELQVGLRRFPF